MMYLASRAPAVHALSAAVLLVLLLTSADVLWASSYRSHFEYLSPRPGATLVNECSSIIVRSNAKVPPGAPPSIEVTGRTSGRHSGHWVLADDGTTYIFTLDECFASGERVSVVIECAREPDGQSPTGRVTALTYEFAFTTSRDTFDLDPLDVIPGADSVASAPMGAASPEPPSSQPSYRGLPLPMDLPPFNVEIQGSSTDGFVFLAPQAARPPFSPYLVILDNQGLPVFFRRSKGRCFDFKRQMDGTLTYADASDPLCRFLVMDQHYTVVDSWAAVGHRNDFHDFMILPNGHALVQIYDPQIVDMSTIVPGGLEDAEVIGLIIQELDASRNVVFEWRSWDHIPITDTHRPLTAERIDYVHGNALDLDPDGNILSSHRNTDDVVKIDRLTGDIIWRLGGMKSDFLLAGDTQWFTRQHDCRMLPSGNLTVFDNGNASTPQESRYVEYSLDEESMVATLVREIRHQPPLFSPFLGNAQTLENGNVFISWGSKPWVTEVDPRGQVVFEMSYTSERYFRTYRAFRFDWEHHPASRPELWHRTDNQELTLFFTRFGDEDVRKFRVFRRQQSGLVEQVATTTANSLVVHNFQQGSSLPFRVTAVDDAGIETPYSNEIVARPAFAEDTGVLEAVVTVKPRTLNLNSRRGYITVLIQLPDGFGFDPSIMDAELFRLNETVPAVALKSSDREPDVLEAEFPMDQVSAVLEEGRETEVHITGRVGDIPVVGTGYLKVHGIKPRADSTPLASTPRIALYQNCPNPFRFSTNFVFRMSETCHVRLEVFDTSGRKVATVMQEVRPAGTHAVVWNGQDDAGRPAPSGIYFFRLTGGGTMLSRRLVMTP